ncbi:uncharacterized protein LOC125758719 [Rhipicephalus sanguineus]|uniref:uncharacterized protein LOC125758719 n=1 Tax=Rhipicephalus sanguineus TaxID=34632 RepID=UPI0020C304EE|nr:uncharacterized protein LOC125758719 [Rhipicephalus sanguineus]
MDSSITQAVPQLVPQEGDIVVKLTARNAMEADLGELIERYWYDVRFNVFIEGRKSTTYCVSTEQPSTVHLQQLRPIEIAKGHYEVSLLILASKELPELQLETCELPKLFLTIKLKYEVRDWKTPPTKVRKGITCIGYVIDEDEEFHYKE